MPVHGVGIDVVDVGRIAHLVETRGEVFTRRWFTAEEIAQCGDDGSPGSAFAARMAAKEAVWKSLGLGADRAVPWRSIEVLGHGGCEIVTLRNDVAQAAASAGVQTLSVTTTAIGEIAVAMAMSWVER